MIDEPSQRGFSVVEVIVALGVLAGVLISIAGLLVVGNRYVGAGRSSTAALAVATDVIERVGSYGFEQTHAAFGCDAAQPICAVPPTDASLDEWRERLHAVVADSEIELRVEALDAPDLDRATAIRLWVAVRWRDAQRTRTVWLMTVRS